MELQNLLLTLGSGIILPLAQEYLNEYVPKKFRHLVVFILSILVGVFWTWVIGDFNAEYIAANVALIWATSQTVYAKVIKPKVRQ